MQIVSHWWRRRDAAPWPHALDAVCLPHPPRAPSPAARQQPHL